MVCRCSLGGDGRAGRWRSPLPGRCCRSRRVPPALPAEPTAVTLRGTVSPHGARPGTPLSVAIETTFSPPSTPARAVLRMPRGRGHQLAPLPDLQRRHDQRPQKHERLLAEGEDRQRLDRRRRLGGRRLRRAGEADLPQRPRRPLGRLPRRGPQPGRDLRGVRGADTQNQRQIRLRADRAGAVLAAGDQRRLVHRGPQPRRRPSARPPRGEAARRRGWLEATVRCPASRTFPVAADFGFLHVPEPASVLGTVGC